MRVIAKQGRLCPREDPRDPPINDRTVASVPETMYYRRRIADGSLIHAEHAKAAVSTDPAPASGKKAKDGGKE
jgi:hypothetical protein